MKYIKKVILVNFQSHENSVIEFDSQLNVIVGPSDSGKTAILRGIKWALYNEPSGDYFIKEGESHCSVTIIFSDLTKIKRYRSKSKNSYHLYDSNNNEKKFEGFGTTVPEEIIDITGIKKILLDNDHSSTINLSDQLEGSFLLSERGSTRAGSIGRLVGVNVIDDSLKDTLRDIRNLSGQKRHIDNNILELEEELAGYEYLEELRIKINSLDIIRNKISAKEEAKAKYNTIFNKLSDILKNKIQVENYIKKLKDIDALNDIIRKISLNVSKYKYLNDKKYKLSNLSRDIDSDTRLINSLKNTNLVEGILKNISMKSDSEIKIRKLKTNLNNNTVETNKLRDTLIKLDHLEQIELLLNNIHSTSRKLNTIQVMNTEMLSLKRSLDIGKQYLKKLDYTDKISEIYIIMDKKIILFNKLEPILINYKNNKKEIESSIEYLDKLKNSFNINLEKYKSLLLNQETCPFCFSNIDDIKIEHIVSHYD